MIRTSIKNHKDLEVYNLAFDGAMKIFELSKKFPVEERYSMTDQIRRSSRSVCANLAEAWRKRMYVREAFPIAVRRGVSHRVAAFVAKLTDSSSEAAETQTWIEFAVQCNYLDLENGRELYKIYNSILGMLVSMIYNSHQWIIPPNNNKYQLSVISVHCLLFTVHCLLPLVADTNSSSSL